MNGLHEVINAERSFDFLGRRHISTSGCTSAATKTAVFALFLPIQPSDCNEWDCLHEGGDMALPKLLWNFLVI